MTQPRIPGLDPAIQERAGLSDKQAQVLGLSHALGMATVISTPNRPVD